MAFYKRIGPRSMDWNYGGSKWKLSRSKLDLFVECPLCFYLDNKLGVSRPKGFPFNLNSAVDHLLKKEFDIHRVAKTPHPLMKEYGVDAVPFIHSELNSWRENFEGIQCVHKESGLLISGAIDDVWVNKAGELIIVDYKATSKDEKVNLDADWQDGYKRQMEVYQWLLRQKGFKVSNTGYFVYANGLRDKKAFDGKLEFEVILIPYTGSDSWVGKKIIEAKECLDEVLPPKPDSGCDYCNYRKSARDVQEKFIKKPEKGIVVESSKEEFISKRNKKEFTNESTGSLF
jgi:CRISPR/Cas system-associated exonuclease Cas4 (RecB family)